MILWLFWLDLSLVKQMNHLGLLLEKIKQKPELLSFTFSKVCCCPVSALEPGITLWDVIGPAAGWGPEQSLYICWGKTASQTKLELLGSASSHSLLKAEEITTRQNVQRISSLTTHMSGEVRTKGGWLQTAMMVGLGARWFKKLKQGWDMRAQQDSS